MVPPAPALFSTTTGWPSASASPVATSRAVMSTFPPGAKGTMILTGLLGYWANADAARLRASAARIGVRMRFS